MVSTVDNSKKKNEEKDERIWRLKVEILRVSVPTVVLVFILLKPTPNRNPRTCDFFFVQFEHHFERRSLCLIS